MMRNSCLNLLTAVLLVACGMAVASCAKQVAAHDPLGTVTLLPPYAASYPGAPTDRISVQYAVIAIADQAGIHYDWDTSFRHTDPVCRQWVVPVIRNKPFAVAMEKILAPVNLTYTIVNGKVILGYRR